MSKLTTEKFRRMPDTLCHVYPCHRDATGKPQSTYYDKETDTIYIGSLKCTPDGYGTMNMHWTFARLDSSTPGYDLLIDKGRDKFATKEKQEREAAIQLEKDKARCAAFKAELRTLLEKHGACISFSMEGDTHGIYESYVTLSVGSYTDRTGLDYITGDNLSA